MGNEAKNWYRESQIFRGLAGPSTYYFGESNPSPRVQVEIFNVDFI